MKNIFRAASLALGAIVMTASSLSATSGMEANDVTIPFAFRVAKQTLPAGKYRMEQSPSSYAVTLTNKETNERVRVLRSDPGHLRGTMRLVFQTDGNGYVLKQVK